MYGVSFRFEDISDAIALREATGQIPRASPAGDLEIAPHGVGPNRSARHATLHSYNCASITSYDMPERSADWMEQAWRDLAMAGLARDSGFFEWASFISQQAAEKAIKAVYQKHGAVAWGHSVRDLLEGLQAAGREVPADLSGIARSLDRNYIPDGFSRGKPADYFAREDAVSGAERIIQFCDGLLA